MRKKKETKEKKKKDLKNRLAGGKIPPKNKKTKR